MDKQAELMFTLEESITNMGCITDDIQTFFDAHDRQRLTDDQVLNMLIGMRELHRHRYNKLWDTFEEVMKLYKHWKDKEEDNE